MEYSPAQFRWTFFFPQAGESIESDFFNLPEEKCVRPLELNASWREGASRLETFT
jgi:hypothetical protein